jgi:DNA-binding transcriptional regulator YbjK
MGGAVTKYDLKELIEDACAMILRADSQKSDRPTEVDEALHKADFLLEMVNVGKVTTPAQLVAYCLYLSQIAINQPENVKQ